MRSVIAVVRGCCQRFVAQTGTDRRLLRPTQLRPASFYEHRLPLFCRTSASSWRERRACCSYLNQGYGLSLLPQRNATTPNYSLNHARSGSDSLTASTSPIWLRPRRSGPEQSYLGVIFIRFRGPQALKDSLLGPSRGRRRYGINRYRDGNCAITHFVGFHLIGIH